MNIQYTVANPTRNITLLVTSPVEPALRVQTGVRLLPLEKDAHQVAFLDWADSGPRLETLGGEFDANAAMAMASLLAFEEHLTLGESWDLRLSVSGVPDGLVCTVVPVRTCDLVSLTMPLPEIADKSFPLTDGSVTFPVVSFPGVSHILVPAGTVDRTAVREILGYWSTLLPTPAVGLLLWNEDAPFFDTLLYRKATGTVDWLSSSADGAAAIAAYLTERRGADQSLSLKQPGGTIAAVTRWEAGLVSLTVSGTVELKRDETVDLVF